MGTVVVSVSYCQEVSPICKRKMPQIDLNCRKFCRSFCRFGYNFCTFSESFCCDFQHNQLNNKRTNFASLFKMRTLQCFASKTLQSKNFSAFVFVPLVCFLNRFEVRMLANVQQRPSTNFFSLLKEYLQFSFEKWLKIDRKKSKMSKFLSVSDIFCEFLFEFGKFR